MRFDQFIPCDQLKPFIQVFAIQEADDENTYRVLPGTQVVIGFQFSGRLSIIGDGGESQLAVAGMSALSDRARFFKRSENIGSVLVYFREMGASPFFRQPIHELFRESVSLDNFWLRSELLVLQEQLYESKTDLQRIGHAEKFLLARLNPSQPDKLVAEAIALIQQANGNIRITELAEKLNISQSPLEKRFRQSVGATAKKFASIVRMKHVLNNLNSNASVTQVAYDAGFYDQAHFIREFKSFTGETPTSFLRDSDR